MRNGAVWAAIWALKFWIVRQFVEQTEAKGMGPYALPWIRASFLLEC